MITILKKAIKKVMLGLVNWWMYWQINEEYDQVVSSKEYWEVMSKVVRELMKLSRREQLILATVLIDDKVMWLYTKVMMEISNDGSVLEYK